MEVGENRHSGDFTAGAGCHRNLESTAANGRLGLSGLFGFSGWFGDLANDTDRIDQTDHNRLAWKTWPLSCKHKGAWADNVLFASITTGLTP